jgi:hypothetical protein
MPEFFSTLNTSPIHEFHSTFNNPNMLEFCNTLNTSHTPELCSTLNTLRMAQFYISLNCFALCNAPRGQLDVKLLLILKHIVLFRSQIGLEVLVYGGSCLRTFNFIMRDNSVWFKVDV